MRRGNQGKAVHRAPDGKLIGVNLGADFTSEHEWGIADLRRKFGVDCNQVGVDGRIIRQVPREHILFDAVTIGIDDYSGKRRKTSKQTWWGLVCCTYPLDVMRQPTLTAEFVKQSELMPYCLDGEMIGSWDERSFGVLCKDETTVRELSDAMDKLDLCLGLFNPTPTNPFSRSGLGLLIASRIPDTIKTAWSEADQGSRDLQAASDATGINDRLRVAGKTFYALRPSWNENGAKTNYKVVFWLNPCEQDRNNYGWFTVEQLDEWIKGRGPIPKKVMA